MENILIVILQLRTVTGHIGQALLGECVHHLAEQVPHLGAATLADQLEAAPVHPDVRLQIEPKIDEIEEKDMDGLYLWALKTRGTGSKFKSPSRVRGSKARGCPT